MVSTPQHIRMRPGSGGIVIGDDDDSFFHQCIMEDLEDELDAEFMNMRHGVPITYQAGRKKGLQELYSVSPARTLRSPHKFAGYTRGGPSTAMRQPDLLAGTAASPASPAVATHIQSSGYLHLVPETKAAAPAKPGPKASQGAARATTKSQPLQQAPSPRTAPPGMYLKFLLSASDLMEGESFPALELLKKLEGVPTGEGFPHLYKVLDNGTGRALSLLRIAAGGEGFPHLYKVLDNGTGRALSLLRIAAGGEGAGSNSGKKTQGLSVMELLVEASIERLPALQVMLHATGTTPSSFHGMWPLHLLSDAAQRMGYQSEKITQLLEMGDRTPHLEPPRSMHILMSASMPARFSALMKLEAAASKC